MLFLFLNIVLLSAFGLFLKHAKDHQQRLNPIGFANYATAFLISVWFLTPERLFDFSALSFGLGTLNGITYAAEFELFKLGIRLSGIIVTAAVVRLSIVVPILGVMLVWQEFPNFWQSIGLLLILGAIPLLSQREKEQVYTFTPGRPQISQGLGFTVVITIMVVAGISRLNMTAFIELCPIEDKPLYMSLLFGTSTLIYLVICLYQRVWPNWWEVFYGALIGICNAAGSWALLKALDKMSGLIVSPMSSSGVVLFTMIVGMLFFRERLSRATLIGAILAVIALIFINMRT